MPQAAAVQLHSGQSRFQLLDIDLVFPAHIMRAVPPNLQEV